jgi:hypothetical protein
MQHSAESLLQYLRVSQRIRNLMQNWFYPLISDQCEIDWWKKAEGRLRLLNTDKSQTFFLALPGYSYLSFNWIGICNDVSRILSNNAKFNVLYHTRK